MYKNKLNWRNVVATVICLAVTAMIASCNKDDNQVKNSLTGKWSVTPSYEAAVEITKNDIIFIMGNNETWSYKWISDSVIEIVKSGYKTRNDIIFHTRDSITIKGFWSTEASVLPPENYDAILTRVNW